MGKSLFKPRRITGTITIGDRAIHRDPHFDKKLATRKIDIDDIKAAITDPDAIQPSTDYTNAHAYIKHLRADVGIKVVMKDDKEPEIIITAYYI